MCLSNKNTNNGEDCILTLVEKLKQVETLLPYEAWFYYFAITN